MEKIRISKVLKSEYVGYILTDSNGQLVRADIESYNQLLNIPIESDGEIHPIMFNTDRIKLYNQFKQYCADNKLSDIFKANVRTIIKPDKRVVCNDTGEVFKNPAEASRAHNISYDALLKHLKGTPYYKSVKGRVYSYAN